MGSVIITGGTGLVGKRLCALLKEAGYEVRILTRNPKNPSEYQWDLDKGYIDPKVFEGAEAIFHLAGASVADQRWSEARKQEIIDSRVTSQRLLYQYLSNHSHTIQTFISASAVGYYGDCGDTLLTEDSPNGSGFLAEVCKVWEAEAEQIAQLGIPVSIVRIGVVLSNAGGALPKLSLPIKFGMGSYMGSGKQYMPWIHVDDLCNLFIYLLRKKLNGVFNACAPEIKTNKEMTAAIANALGRPFLPMPVPAILLKTIMGEMATIMLMSNRCDPGKIVKSGFIFQYPELKRALEQLFHS